MANCFQNVTTDVWFFHSYDRDVALPRPKLEQEEVEPPNLNLGIKHAEDGVQFEETTLKVIQLQAKRLEYL